MKKKPFEIPEWIRPWQRGVRQGGSMNLKVMRNNLLDIKEVLDKYKIPFVLIGGGLLGAIRSEQFIPYDYDLDIACFSGTSRHDHWKMRWVKNELENKGFYIVDNSRCRCKADFFIRNKERIDIFWFEKIDEEWIYNNSYRYPAIFFDTLDEIEFLGTKFKVPHNPKRFLRYTYGKDWRTPKPGAHLLDLNPKEVKRRKKCEKGK